jgi:hypothetical protein
MIGILGAIGCLALLAVTTAELRAAFRGERCLEPRDATLYVSPFVASLAGLALTAVAIAEGDAMLQLLGAGLLPLVALLTSPLPRHLSSLAPLRLKREHGAPSSQSSSTR